MKTCKEMASIWNVTERTVTTFCKTGKISGAIKVGKSWQIPDDAEKEYELLRDDMISALNDGRTLIPGFDYLPEHVTFFKNYVVANRGSIYSEHGFCRYLDVDRMVNLFAHCTPAQMNDVRSVFLDLYRINNAKEIFINDLPALEELLMGIETTWERPDVDRVQLLQYKWFAENLRKIIDSLR